MTDYLAAFLESPRDLKHYGRKGMKWGQRIFTKGGGDKSAGGKTEAAPAKAAAPEPAKRPSGNIQDNVESSAARYYRLQAVAKAGGAGTMTEQDLKFFNARTDALAKINKMNETQPSWLRETATKVVQQSAQRQMQGLADALADKYVGDPIKNALKGAAEVNAATKGSIKVRKSDPAEPAVSAKKTAVDAAKKVVASTSSTKKADSSDTPASTKKADAPDPTKMRFEDALNFYKDNPSVTPTPPEGYSPNAQKLFMTELEARRKE